MKTTPQQAGFRTLNNDLCIVMHAFGVSMDGQTLVLRDRVRISDFLIFLYNKL